MEIGTRGLKTEDLGRGVGIGTMKEYDGSTRGRKDGRRVGHGSGLEWNKKGFERTNETTGFSWTWRSRPRGFVAGKSLYVWIHSPFFSVEIKVIGSRL